MMSFSRVAPKMGLTKFTTSHHHRQSSADKKTNRRSKVHFRTITFGQLVVLVAITGLLSVGSIAGVSAQDDDDSTRTITDSPETADIEETSLPDTTTTTTTSTTTSTTIAPTTSHKTKIAPVNFTLINEAFERTLNESEVVSKWLSMDKQMRDGVRNILKVVFPQLVSMSSDAKVSGACSGAILKWSLNLRNMRTWAVKMLDAIGKPSAGILEGSLTMFGNYKQCLAIRAPDEDEIDLVEEFREYFRGQYCVLELKPPLPDRTSYYSLNSTISKLQRPTSSYKYHEKTTYDELSELAMAFNFVSIRADLCVPSLCSRDDIQRVANFLASKLEMRAKVSRCEQDPQPGIDRSEIDYSLVGWAIAIGVILALTVVSTTLHLIDGDVDRQSVTSMSIQKSIAHTMEVRLDEINETKPTFLYSIRVILVLWIALVSLTSQLEFQFLRELLSLRSLIMQLPMQLLVNSSLAFDSFILLTGFTYSYEMINANGADLAKRLVIKYFRLVPSIIFAVGLTLLVPQLPGATSAGLSPVWHDFVDGPASTCRSSLALFNLAFLQNWLPAEKICLPHTWLFCVEFQLCLLALPLLVLMNRRFDRDQGRFRLLAPANLVLVAVVALGAWANYSNTKRHKLPPAWFLTYPDKRDRNHYQTEHLFKTWTHLIPFAIGLFTGHLSRCLSIDTFSGRPYGRKSCNALLWFFSFSIMLSVIFSTHAWSISGTSHLDSPNLVALYSALAPLLWSIALGLILFNFTVPNKRLERPQLSQFLCSQAWLVRLGRLSFLFYLLGPLVNQVILGLQEQAIFSSIILMGHTFLGNSVITLLLALLVSLLIELPCRRAVKKAALGSHRKCTNLGIINRQLQIQEHNLGPMRGSYDTKQGPPAR